jgi:hypothetical protein
MPKPATRPRFDVSSLVGPLFFLWLVQLLLPSTVVALVYEKHHRLRLIMRMHGLANSAPCLPCSFPFQLERLLMPVVCASRAPCNSYNPSLHAPAPLCSPAHPFNHSCMHMQVPTYL